MRATANTATRVETASIRDASAVTPSATETEPAEHEQPPPAGRLPRLLRDVSDRIEQGMPKRTGRLVRLIGLLRFHSFLQSIPAGRRSSPRRSLLVAFGSTLSAPASHRHGNWRSHVVGSSDGCSSLGLTADVGSQHAGRIRRHTTESYGHGCHEPAVRKNERRRGACADRMDRDGELSRRARRSWRRRLRRLALIDQAADTDPRRLARRGLFERLSAGSPVGVTLVSAPAGSGKTVLLRSWIERRLGSPITSPGSPSNAVSEIPSGSGWQWSMRCALPSALMRSSRS